ncbi:MAG: NAD(P)-dependent glycerol-1-phosphate dehydrogenase [Acidilobus sp.]
MSQATHIIDLPKRVVVGEGVLEQLGKHVQDLLPRGALVYIVTGQNVLQLFYKRVKEVLEDAGYSTTYIIAGPATVSEAERVAEEAKRDRADVLLGLGGGRSIDLAKYAAAELKKDFISVPTAPSHDGITSPFATLKGFERPYSKIARPPKLLLLDIDVLGSAPRRLAAAGFGDLIGKFTAVLDWRLAHRLRGEYYGAYAASLALMSAKHVSSYAREIGLGKKEGLRALVEALVSSGVAMCIAGSSRPASGSEHLFAHALEVVSASPPLHGEAVGVGTIMMSYLHGLRWSRIKRLLKLVGAPTTAKELGVKDEEVIEALVRAASIRPERYTILGEKGLTREAAEELAIRTGVIG